MKYSFQKKNKLCCSFKFSVVMAIFNTEAYLSEAIDSVVGQSLGFEDNVQLILVDDGSTDGSLDIIREYEKKYPDNIIVLSQENMGQATARNNGLNYVQGKYVNFLDSDDYLSENTLKEVYNFFEKHENETDIVSIPITMFGRIEREHPLNHKFDKGNRVIDLVKEPNNPQLSAASSFFKRDILFGKKFPVKIISSEDATLINKLLLRKKTIGVVSSTEYLYRQRNNLSSTIDNLYLKKEGYTDRLKYYFIELINYCLVNENHIPKFIQYTLAHDLQWMLMVSELEVFDTKEELNEFLEKLNIVINYIDENIIINQFTIKDFIKPFFLFLKRKEYNIEVKNDHVVWMNVGDYNLDKLNNHKLWLDIVEIKDGYLNISGLFNSNFSKDSLNIYLVKETGLIQVFDCEYVKYTHPDHNNIKYLYIDWLYRYSFDVKVPLKDMDEAKFVFKIIFSEDLDLISFKPSIAFSRNVNLSSFGNYFVKNSQMIIFKNNSFYLKPYTYNLMLKSELEVFKKILLNRPKEYLMGLLIRLSYILLFPFFKNKRIWLFADRPDFADDNAKHLFNYASKKEDGIEKYYLINKNTKYFNDMKNIDNNIVNFGSFKHKFLYLFAEKNICSYINENFVNPFFYNNFQLYKGLNTSKQYFLQHGVTKDDVSFFIKKYSKNLSLILTVSNLERDSFLEKGYNFDKDIVPVLGFPRYDNLDENIPKKWILFMPTWRMQFKREESFLNSEYFYSLNNFLNNEKLLQMIDEEGYTLIFKPHPELEKYLDLITIDDRIRISHNDSYQDLFKKSDILITDYSSVVFDFGYLKKPIIYYQPNNDYHYDKGYFNYETMGFGEIINQEKNLINKIEYYLINKNMEIKYQRRVDNFFKYNDKNNCKRVYEWIHLN